MSTVLLIFYFVSASSLLFPVKMLPQSEFWCGLSVLSFLQFVFFLVNEGCIQGNQFPICYNGGFYCFKFLFVFSVHKVNKSTPEYVIEKRTSCKFI